MSAHPPRMDRLLAALGDAFPRALSKAAAREVLAEARAAGRIPELEGCAEAVRQKLRNWTRPVVVHTINATGVVLHTGLGRAPLGEAAAAVAREAAAYTIVEVDRRSGHRNQREDGLQRMLCDLTGAEAGTVVNNNAGATLLVLAALARGREAIVSRSELVEIGGGFRIPEVMQESGTLLREVGTTNRTRLSDYERAIGENSGMLLKVHRSNFRVVGFTAEVDLPELVGLGRARGLPVVYDMGSGCLEDVSGLGIEDEPVVRASLQTGIDLALFSGDKLLGGPQAGIIVGKREAVAQVRRHPLFRALRPGKLTLAALEAVLRSYWLGRSQELPVQRILRARPEELRRRAEALAMGLAGVAVEPSETRIGSGAAPTSGLPSYALRLAGKAQNLAHRLRNGEPPVFGRVQAGALWLDVRTVLPEEDAALRAVLERELGAL